jgi:hypothetical protein
MKLLNEAKGTLSDPIKRSKFDQKVGIDIYKDLRKLNSFKTEAQVTRSAPEENFFQNGYGQQGYARDGGAAYDPHQYGYDQQNYNNQNQANTNQGQYAQGDDRYYYTGQRYQSNQAEKQTYLCPYCNKKFRMVTPKDIMITSCPTCQNNITIYPE